MTHPLPPLSAPNETLVVVGAGLAGLRCAETARAEGFPGRIILVGEEPHVPYDRPPLSKAVLLEPGAEATIGLSTTEALADANVELRLGQPAAAIDREGRALVLADGARIAYDRLVLATGSATRTLRDLPPGRPGVHYLRGLDDALALRAALADARRVVVIGAGVIGLEVAAAAVAPARSVTVIEAADRVMGRATCPAISAFMADQHRAAGVVLKLSASVAGVAATGNGYALELSDGSTVEADLVVVGVGVTPNDALARDCGLEVEAGGVCVDGYGMTSDPAIYAAGEVAVHFNARHGRHDRQETWAHADAHGEHVGRALVAPEADYDALGSYWSDQYDVTLNVLGAPAGEIDVVRGDPGEGKFLVFHLADGKLAGVSAVNDTRGLRAAKALIGLDVDAAALADPAADLKAMA